MRTDPASGKDEDRLLPGDDRPGNYPTEVAHFLGYEFRPRLSRRRGEKIGDSFSPAASSKALKQIRHTVRSWSLHQRSDKSLNDLARIFNSYIRGWINYYGRYYKSALYPTLRHIDVILARWAHRKFKIPSTPPAAIKALARSHCAATARAVCSLGPPSRARLNTGSRIEGRPSRTVLRAPGGEIPLGDSP